VISHCSWPIAALSLLLACDSGADAKPADVKPADAKPADVKKADVRPADAKPAAKKADVHFDVGQDKSGVLARSAAVIEVSKAHDDDNLRALSHHAEALSSVEALCKHEAEVGKTDVALPDCIKAMEHHVVQIGPEVYAQLATCIMAATTVEAIEACDAAEREAEQALHAKPHGDGLSSEVCEGLFTHFETLAMADAGDHAELVKGVLEEVKVDVITTCGEQGTKAEVDCAMQAKTMTELQECASKLL
jgi:hypothetical protein